MTIHDFIDTLKPLNPGQLFLMLYFLEDGDKQDLEQVASFVESQTHQPVESRDCLRVYQRMNTLLQTEEDGSLFNRFMSHLSRFIYAEDSLSKFGDSHFADWGYAPVDPIIDKSVPSYEKYRAQLYYHVVRGIDLAGRRVLDVGCGLGGGTSFLRRVHKPKLIVGVDNAENRIDFCRNAYKLSGLEFRLGDALNLQFDDEMFDVIVNVESSHAYSSIDKFLNETYRVLGDNGYLLLADLRLRTGMKKLQKQIGSSRFTKLKDKDITANVREARRIESPILMERYSNLLRDSIIDKEEFECLKFLSGLPAYGIRNPLHYVKYMKFVLYKTSSIGI